MITCTSKCVYQRDGLCNLELAGSGGEYGRFSGCIHYVPRGMESNAESTKNNRDLP
ncbi:hypothetical protein LJC34_01190 [Oscillospiraceae bacterium OttesenSCG-928-G22]|nr:hypothetical protein [Oscillospiraceae bacterium OttesenSCG-928-G22]